MIIFDVDGTILPGTSCERLFVRYLITKRILGAKSLLNFVTALFSLLPQGRYFMTKANKGYLRGYSAEKMTGIGYDFFGEAVAPLISRAAIERTRKHQADGERVILFSGMPDFLLGNFAAYLSVKEFHGSAMELSAGRFTGRTLGPFPLGRGKVVALELILDRHDTGWHASPSKGEKHVEMGSHPSPGPMTPSEIDWPSITFYADHWLDRFLLSNVGHPVVVNGQPRLISLARANGWPIEEWK